MDKIKVCIVDDHNLFRKAIVRLVSAFDRVADVTDAENGQDFIDRFKYKMPHVLVLDLEMLKLNGIETTKYLVPRYPDLKIIILTQHDSEQYMLHMLELGVHSFLFKNTEPEELKQAIYAVYDNDFYHNELLANVLRKNAKLKTELPQFEKKEELTDREVEIFTLICEGLAPKEMGQRLNISEKTAHTHAANLRVKLGLKNNVELIKYAYQKGILK